MTFRFPTFAVRNYFLLLALLSTAALTAQIDHWETAVYADDVWSYRPGTSAPPDNWTALGFDDSAWLSGPGGIGYGDGDDLTVIAPAASLYLRRRFTVVDPAKIAAVLLHADFDDGFVAYLNGTEIARANVEGNPPAYDQDATDYREALIYQGGQPESFLVSGLDLATLLLPGENLLAIQVHNRGGAASSDLTGLFWLSFGINDDSSDYGPTPPFQFPLGEFSSNLPILTINTGGPAIPDEPSIPATLGIIWNADGSPNLSDAVPNEFLGEITIEKRGQSSLDLFPKNGYGFETKDEFGEDVDVAFLNFPEEEDWILHGPYSDKSLLRNVLAMEMARGIGQYASRTRQVELVINGQYEGVYVLMERIKRDDNRVDIATLNPEDISGDELTGGYVFKIDKGEADWTSRYDMFNNPGQRLRFQYVSPNRNRIMPEQAAYLQAYVDSFETAMLLPDGTYGGKRYDEYADLASFADHFLLTELSKDVDAYRISSYYHKDKDSNGGLLKAGPVWDFNIAYGNVDYCFGEITSGWMYDVHCGNGNPFWWENMLSDPAFTNLLKCRWEEFRQGPLALSTLFTFLDEQAALLESAAARNFQRWPVLDVYVWPNATIPGTYLGEVEYLKSYLAARLAWMDVNLYGECLPTGTATPAPAQTIQLSPNPTHGPLQLSLHLPQPGELALTVYDQLGRRVHQLPGRDAPSGRRQIDIELPLSLPNALYYLSVHLDGRGLATVPFLLER